MFNVALAVAVQAGGAIPPPPAQTAGSGYAYQVCLGWVSSWNSGCLLIDRGRGMRAGWRWDGTTRVQALDTEHVDSNDWTLRSVPAGQKPFKSVFLERDRYEEFPIEGAGTYVVKAAGPVLNNVVIDPGISTSSTVSVNQIASDHYEITVSEDAFAPGADYAGIIIPRIISMGAGSQIEGFSIYQKEYEANLQAGEIFRPDLMAYIETHYDYVRTINMVDGPKALETSYDDLATLNDHCWGTQVRLEHNRLPQRFRFPHRAVFDIAARYDVKLINHVSVMVGSGKPINDPLFDNSYGYNGDALREYARDNADAILTSPVIDEYYDRYIADMVAAGHPADREHHVEMGVELWNDGYPWVIGARFAQGIGWAFEPSDQYTMQGSGRVAARHMLACQRAQTRAGTSFPIHFRVGGQTYFPYRNGQILLGAKREIERAGELWNDWKDWFNVSLTTYYQIQLDDNNVVPFTSKEQVTADWIAKTATPEGRLQTIQDVHQHFMSGPENLFSIENAVDFWRQNYDVFAEYGKKPDEAYEGDTHFSVQQQGYNDLANDPGFAEFFDMYLKSNEFGIEINKLHNEFVAFEPNIMLSNFTLFGGRRGGSPYEDRFMPADPTSKTPALIERERWGKLARSQNGGT